MQSNETNQDQETQKQEGGGLKTNNDISINNYFKFYSKLSNQANMLQDSIRTECYMNSIYKNPSNFKNKIVLDVGCGSGILSIFAAKAGALRVYAVEASDMACYAKRIIEHNGYQNTIKVISTSIEDLELPEKVDTIISEPLGTFLLNERMLETYIIARDKFLKPDGKMMPTSADLYLMPFTDQTLKDEQDYKSEFWLTKDFYNVDLSSLYEDAIKERYRQPLCDTMKVEQCLSETPEKRVFDFQRCTIADLKSVDWKFNHKINKTSLLHGYSLYFDAFFKGDDEEVVLRTGPGHPVTHWYETRMLLPEPIGVNRGQTIPGHLLMVANDEQCFDTSIKIDIPAICVDRHQTYDMKEPEYRGMYQSYDSELRLQ